MFKRRLALLGAVAVLAVTGLTGSALADETPGPAGAKVTCKTADGESVQMAEALPGAGGRTVGPDGKVREFKPGDTVKVDALPEGEVPPDVWKAVPAQPDGVDVTKVLPTLPDGVEVRKAVPLPEDGKLPEAVQAVPAQPAKPGEKLDAPAAGIKVVKIICEKTD
ncbi:hypothetical protein [Nonomuraea jabiensis]|uniref:Uncharacterized protein n=1 Tax=Nonomuraea jabiensis TaxID=882448 RepID=A0A7W9G2R9_9ACTN|nr:hypothetical protein [Nonomuraea jabiensis]MBB5776116.1 hypothetical protein [Nonomuraea jabiensis]